MTAEPWRAAWDAWRITGGFGPAPDTGDDEIDDRWREAWAAAAQAGHAAIAAQQPQPAPELAAAMAETRELRELLAEVIDSFVKTSDGYRARVGQVQIAKWHKRGGLPA